jgi:hypothetical protein
MPNSNLISTNVGWVLKKSENQTRFQANFQFETLKVSH